MRAAPWKRAANGRTPTEIYILGESKGNHLSFAPLVVRFFDFTRKGMASHQRATRGISSSDGGGD